MHELSVAQALLEQCERALATAGHGCSGLRVVHLTLGELAGVDGEQLRTAWDLLCRARGIEVRLRIAPQGAGLRCARCGPCERPLSGGWLRLCPGCGAPLVVEGGYELILERLELESTERDPCVPMNEEWLR